MMKQELIEKSNSSVYVIFVKKKDDRIRFYIDYNWLNEIITFIVKNRRYSQYFIWFLPIIIDF